MRSAPAAKLALIPALALAALEACGSSGAPNGASPADASVRSDGTAPGPADGGPEASANEGGPADGGGSDGLAAGDAGAGCARTPAPADRARYVVASHPFAADGGAAAVFEVLDLSQGGALTRPATPVLFAMGPASNAPIVFTPDGEVGLVAQDDGTIGVFRLDAAGTPTVVHAGYRGVFYAMQLVVSADGSHVYGLDLDTAPNKGGVYELAIGCDGTLSNEALVVPGGNAYAMALVPTAPTEALLAAGAAFGSPATADTDLVDLASLSLIGSTEAFGGDAGSALPSSVAVAPDGKYALVADNGITAGSRLAVVGISAPHLTAVGVLATPSPTAVVISPFDNAALVLNDDSTDQIHVLTYDPANAATPFVLTGQLAYKFPPPQIPTTASVIAQGSLMGTVFVSENTAVR